MDVDGDMEMSVAPIRFQTQDNYEVDEDGSITLSVKLDKDQVECCICYQSMTGSIYRCRSTNNVVHNVCFECEWQLRRLKEGNGHVKDERCPICKTTGTFMRNKVLEGQLQDLCNPCAYGKRGCTKKFFRWCNEAKEEHEKNCLHREVRCPVCCVSIPGCQELPAHLSSGNCMCGEFEEISSIVDKQKHQLVDFTSHQNSFLHNKSQNYVILFIWKNVYFEIVAVNLDGNFDGCNKQITIQIVNTKELQNYQNSLKSNSYLETLTVPQRHTMQLNIGAFQQKQKLPEKSFPLGHYFTGELVEPTTFTCRFYSLAELLQQGCVLDCRDYFGKWYESEILHITRENPYCGARPDCDRVRIKVHYLGYSSSYDEWFDLGRDTSRIAPAGTYTVGPNLRTVRRSAQLSQQVNVNCPEFRQGHPRGLRNMRAASEVLQNYR